MRFGKFGSTRRNKYKAEKVTIDGITFDSKAEGEYYSQLRLMERAGEAKILELQPKVYLTKAKIEYRPDFHVDFGNQIVFVDVKGMETRDFKLKAKLWKYYGPGNLWLVEKNGFSFSIKKEIVPIKEE